MRWFEHVEQINDKRIAKRVYESGVEGRLGRERPNIMWMDGVKKALNDSGLTLEQE